MRYARAVAKKLRSILVPVDGSAPAKRAAALAARLADGTEAVVTLLYVDVPGAKTKAKAAREHEALETFKEATKAFGRGAIEARLVTRSGDPGPTVVELAAELEPDLLVVGRRGVGRVRALMLGSVSEYVLAHVSCPVTIVK
jgi:nucleotide-binding universal stress UspA family protein